MSYFPANLRRHVKNSGFSQNTVDKRIFVCYGVHVKRKMMQSL